MSHTEATPTRREAARESIPCAFCRGRGVDPFAIMSDLSACGSCGGRGQVQVPRPHVRCAFCRGSGSYKTYRCPSCGGAGEVGAIDGPTKTCPGCAGHAFEASSGLPCLKCRGRGVVPH